MVEHRDFVAVLSPGHARVTQPRRVLGTENALRVVLASELIRRGGLLLHAAGVSTRAGAVVAFGRSGAGKSTFARLARGRPILSDDLVALVPNGRSWVAHATPFGGSAASRRRRRSAPLRALLRLHQHRRPIVSRLSAARGAAELMRSLVLPAGSVVERAMALDRCLALQSAVSVQTFAFAVDHRMWRFLEREL